MSHKTFNFIVTPAGVTVQQRSGKTIRQCFVGRSTLEKMLEDSRTLGKLEQIEYDWNGLRKGGR